MKIAVIGAGISGLASAYLLSGEHEVDVYEKDSRIGGHAHTLTVNEGFKTVNVDNGFMVFNPKRYPNFVKMINALGVESVRTRMSFATTIPGQVSYRDTFPLGLFADAKNLFSKRFWKFLIGVVRLRNVAKRMVKNRDHSEESLGNFLKRNNINDDVVRWALFPLMQSIWSIKDGTKILDFPALASFTFLDNHRILDVFRPYWRTIKGGSVRYVEKVRERIEKNGSIIITNASIYDYILFATHADVTLQLLKDPSPEEVRVLSKFSFAKNKTILHKDKSVLPVNRRLWASWNYVQDSRSDHVEQKGVFTYYMNRLQNIDKKMPVFVSLNPSKVIAKNNIYHSELYTHPEFTVDVVNAQKEIIKIQNVNRTLYAGAYLGYGFHEDGVVSAIRAIKYLGISPRW
jgi:uncharacterized protein